MKKLLLIMILICSVSFCQEVEIIDDITTNNIIDADDYSELLVGSYTSTAPLSITYANKFVFENCCEIDTTTGEITLLSNYGEKITANKSAKLFWEIFESTFKAKLAEERAKQHLNSVIVPIEEYERLTKIDKILKDIYEHIKNIKDKQ